MASLDIFDRIGGSNPKLWGLPLVSRRPSNISALPQISLDNSGFRIMDQADTVSYLTELDSLSHSLLLRSSAPLPCRPVRGRRGHDNLCVAFAFSNSTGSREGI